MVLVHFVWNFIGVSSVKLGSFHRRKKVFIKDFKIFMMMVLFFRFKKTVFETKKIKNILIMRDNNKLGDMIIFTPLFRECHRLGLDVSVVTGDVCAELLKENKNIKHIFVCKEHFFNMFFLALKLRKKKYDLIIDPLNEVHSYRSIMMMQVINPKHILGFNKEGKYKTYDISLSEDLSLNRHTSERIKSILQKINPDIDLDKIDLSYELPIPSDVDNTVKQYLERFNGKKTVLLNPFGALKTRKFSAAKINSIVDIIKKKIANPVIIISGLESEIKDIEIDGVEKTPFTRYIHATSLVKQVDYIVSVDTSIVHAATAFNKPIVAFYPMSKARVNSQPLTWGPNSEHAIQVLSDTRNVEDIPDDIIKYAIENMISMRS